ncbi:syntaxin-2-like isoform X2 [Antennarius striatus]|uniref:syntaxin-2-like isoform X2 n=1 Tax=Antennarius striatus TaxID=241820 RepID=UPI0035B1F64C
MTWYVSETAESNMEDFFRTVGEVSNLIEKVCCEVDQVEMSHGVILSTPNKEKKNKEKLEQHNKEIKKNANLIRAKLKTMQKDFPVAENSRSASVIHRIQRNQHSHLTRRFADIMKGYHKAQISFREKCKVQIQRQLDVVNKPTTDEELEEMLQCDNLSIFVSDINSNAQISSQALSKIESRHQDILCLESSIEELHEIFADTAMLLESQGDLINNIEKNVTSAAEYVDMSKEETSKAVTYKKNRYKIVSVPSFFRSFRRKSSVETDGDRNTSDTHQD